MAQALALRTVAGPHYGASKQRQALRAQLRPGLKPHRPGEKLPGTVTSAAGQASPKQTQLSTAIHTLAIRSSAPAPPLLFQQRCSQSNAALTFGSRYPCHVASAFARGQRFRDADVDVDVEVDQEDDDFEDDWDDETFAKQAPPQRDSTVTGLTELDLNRWRLKPVEEKYRIQVERGISEERKKELGVEFWSSWSSPGPCAYQWEWRADEQVFITRGTLRVTPFGSSDSAVFSAGDLVRFPKWMLAELEIAGSFEQRYRFRAYGDDN